jgi:hypothetical protein
MLMFLHVFMFIIYCFAKDLPFIQSFIIAKGLISRLSCDGQNREEKILSLEESVKNLKIQYEASIEKEKEKHEQMVKDMKTLEDRNALILSDFKAEKASAQKISERLETAEKSLQEAKKTAEAQQKELDALRSQVSGKDKELDDLRAEMQTLRESQAAKDRVNFAKASECVSLINLVSENTGVRPSPRAFGEGDLAGALVWIREEASSIPSLTTSYGGYCALAGARATALSLEARGCNHVADAGTPGFPLCSPERVFDASRSAENVGRRVYSLLWQQGLGTIVADKIRERLRLVSCPWFIFFKKLFIY